DNSHVSRVQRLRCFFFSSRRRHTRLKRDWSSDVCSSDLTGQLGCRGGCGPVHGRTRGCGLCLGLSLLRGGDPPPPGPLLRLTARSEERRLGKECRWQRARSQREEKGQREERVE